MNFQVVDNKAILDSAFSWSTIGTPLFIPGVGTLVPVTQSGLQVAAMDEGALTYSETLDAGFGGHADSGGDSSATMILAYYSGKLFLIYFGVNGTEAHLRVGFVAPENYQTAANWTWQTVWRFDTPSTPFTGIPTPYVYQGGSYNQLAAAVDGSQLLISAIVQFKSGATTYDSMGSFALFF